jgi:hypothetical protein
MVVSLISFMIWLCMMFLGLLAIESSCAFNIILSVWIYMNNNQHNALFIFSVLSYHTSSCFRCIRRQNEYMWQMVLVILSVDCQRAWPTDCQLRSITSTICHIYSFFLLMTGCWCAIYEEISGIPNCIRCCDSFNTVCT